MPRPSVKKQTPRRRLVAIIVRVKRVPAPATRVRARPSVRARIATAHNAHAPRANAPVAKAVAKKPNRHPAAAAKKSDARHNSSHSANVDQCFQRWPGGGHLFLYQEKLKKACRKMGNHILRVPGPAGLAVWRQRWIDPCFPDATAGIFTHKTVCVHHKKPVAHANR